ncbi:MAG: hypothetical protein JW762_06660 [Dehalococcoidales bacterium]|nr:hypothetical protein [Dehalococcoidales bacterium]
MKSKKEFSAIGTIVIVLIFVLLLSVIGAGCSSSSETKDVKKILTVDNVSESEVFNKLPIRQITYENFALIGFKNKLINLFNSYSSGQLSEEDLDLLRREDRSFTLVSNLLFSSSEEIKEEFQNDDVNEALSWHNNASNLVSDLFRFVEHAFYSDEKPSAPRSVQIECDPEGNYHYFKGDQELSEQEVLSIFDQQIEEDVQRSTDSLNKYWEQEKES